FGEVTAARLTQRRSDCRKQLQIGLAGFDLAVQHSQRIGLVSLLAAPAQVWQVLCYCLLQPSNVLGPAVLIAYRIDQQDVIVDSELAQEPFEHLDHFDFYGRVIALSQNLCSDLPKLAVAAFLGPLAPELRADIKELGEPRMVVTTMLDVRPNY